MFKLYQNFVSNEDLEYFKSKFDQYYAEHRFIGKYYIDHKDTIKEVFGLDDNVLTQQSRIDIHKESVGQRVREVLSSVQSISENTEIYFVRSHFPIGLHVDTDFLTTGKTFLIPLTVDERIKTVAFVNEMVNADFKDLADRFTQTPEEFNRVNVLSKQLSMRNCWFGEPNIVDYLPVDGIASWAKGSLISFKRMQLHASNNYRELVDYKDYILIHTDN